VDYRRYTGASILTPNRGELSQAVNAPVSGDTALVDAARKLRDSTRVQAILVTRSGEGMTLVTESVAHLPAEAREVSDVTGAGDTVVAALAMGLAAGGVFADAARIANIAAGLVVARHGTAVATIADISAALLRAGMAGFEQKVADRKTAAGPRCVASTGAQDLRPPDRGAQQRRIGETSQRRRPPNPNRGGAGHRHGVHGARRSRGCI
jgi:D-beta-D-heptose 7-phosphate kinase/D-beta-D-heptose 1-phosphate adenosyltransferase